MSLTTSSPGTCSTYTACPNGPVTLELVPHSSGGFPPAEYDPGYTVQPCDVVEWSFGDGTSQSVTGSNRVTHEYPNPGNYSVQATVSNALGSTILSGRDMVIATSPSRLSFATRTFKVVHSGGQWTCADCVEVREGVFTTITVMRSLDLSRSTSAEAIVTLGTEVRVPLSFAPGETQKTFGVNVPDDSAYSGVRTFPLYFLNPAGGILTSTNGPHPTLVMIDDDPPPFLSIQTELFVAEGDAELTPLLIPAFLTAPMGVGCLAASYFTPGSATHEDYISGGGLHIKAGETTGFVRGWIKGDAHPEPNKSFQVRIAPTGTGSDPYFGAKNSTVTILNDDAALDPARVKVNVPIETPIRLTLDIGSANFSATTAVFTSSNVDVVPVPEPMVIPAGATKIDVFVTPRRAGTAVIGAVVPGRTTAPAEVVATSARRRAAAH
jgi:PKD repeat protein